MPPSPSVRRSPGRELRGDDHKRGRSLEGGILFREKDEDLPLFNEVQNRERDNFLLHSNDDFEDTFTAKLRYFSDHKLGISVPVRGETSNLLNAEGEKNDYDWLITPPDTPLFTSLDDEAPPPNLSQRGRPRSQPISISRSSTMEKGRRSSRGSPSPNRLSPSPRSGSSIAQARGRTSSAPHSSPSPSLQHGSPLRRPSPSPGKPSTPTRRSTTPTPRRVSTSSISTVASSGLRSISPVKTNRGNSASPKVRAWQSNIPGFPSEAPPNLRTSLADRPASYVRGSSPASRNGIDFSSKPGRQSMSPPTTRSISSSHNHDRDRFSPHIKGSIASSGDDDVDSLVSIPMASSGRSSTRRVGSLQNNRAPAFSKKPSRAVVSSSAPKRSIDLALRQMDHRKSPQNMFRPLLSSVPSSTFYIGKTGAAQRAIISRNSSVTTSSNASSDQVAGDAHDTEGSEQYQEDVTSGFAKDPCPDFQDDVLDLDKSDGLNENVENETQDGSLFSHYTNLGGSCTVDSHTDGFEGCGDHCTATADAATSDTLNTNDSSLHVDGLENLVLCQNCGHVYSATEPVEGELSICHNCRSALLTISNVVTPTISTENFPEEFSNNVEKSSSLDVTYPPVAAPVSAGLTVMAESRTRENENTIEENLTSYCEPISDFVSTEFVNVSRILVEEGDHRHVNQQVVGEPTVTYNEPDCGTSQQMQQPLDYPMIDVSGGTGISVLLNRSSNSGGAIHQSRSFTASSISYDDSSYLRDSAYSLKSSYGHGSLSASSSVDLGSYRQMGARVQRQLSGKQSDHENYRCDMNSRHRRTGSSLSVSSNPALQPSGTSIHERSPDVSLSRVKNDADRNFIDAQEQVLSEDMEVDDTYTDVESNHKCRMLDTSHSELSSHINMHQSTLLTFSNSEESSSHGNSEDSTNNMKNAGDVAASVIPMEPSIVEEETMPSSSVDRFNIAQVTSYSSLEKISEIEGENAPEGSSDMPHDVVSSSSRSSIDDIVEPHIIATSEQSFTTLPTEPDTLSHEHCTHGESMVLLEGKGGSTAKSLTLEEATDTILFCSSVVQNMAYNAATIAIEKENSAPLEGSWPTVTILGKANPERKDALARTAVKRTSKSQKVKQRRSETDMKSPDNTKNDENIEVSTNRIVGVHNNNDKSMKAPPKLESKCNCTIM